MGKSNNKYVSRKKTGLAYISILVLFVLESIVFNHLHNIDTMKVATMTVRIFLLIACCAIGSCYSSSANSNINNAINSNNNGDGGSGGSSGASNAAANNNNNRHNSNLGGIGSDTMQLSSRVVHTKYGALTGVIVHLEGRHLDPVEAFKGIPYASPPTGNLRFMPPVSGALWPGVRKADR